MTQFVSTRLINASREEVFDVIAHIDRYAEIIPHILRFEILSEQKTGAGTEFRETRLMGKREFSSVMTVTEYSPPEAVRLVSTAGGTRWDSVFRFEQADGGCKLSLTMDAQPKNPFAALLNLVIKKSVQRGIDEDMDLIEQHFA